MRMMAPVAACSEWVEKNVKSMGSRAILIVGDPGDGDIEWALASLQEMERCWSRFIDDSELSELNRSAGRWFPMSPLLATAVDKARLMYALTDGRFDPTVLTSLRSLGYNQSFAAIGASAPTTPEIQPPPGLHCVERERHWIRLPEGLELDLGGIGKGLAADLIATGLVERGSASVCVSMGGDIRVAGAVPEGGWRIPVTDPIHTGASIGAVAISDGALVTSTTMYRRWQRDDVVFHHIIDPTTGDSARAGVAAAVVAAKSAALAEAIAKAALIAGVDDGLDLIERCGGAGWMITDDGELLPTVNAPDMATLQPAGAVEQA